MSPGRVEGRLAETEELEMTLRMRMADESGRDVRVELRFSERETSEYER